MTPRTRAILADWIAGACLIGLLFTLPWIAWGIQELMK